MPDQVYIGNFKKGQNNYFAAFNIDNDAFPILYNFYSWRGRVKKKRGTSLLGRLRRQVQSTAAPNFNDDPYLFGPLALVSGAGNLITGPWSVKGNASYSLETTSSIVPGSISVIVGANTYTDPSQNGTLVGAPAGSGTINYATGAITISGGGVGPLTGTFSYYSELPVMGLRDFSYSGSSLQYPVPLAFDTKYSYQLNQTSASSLFFYNVNFFKNSEVPFVWSGQDYQQFWTTNYQSALWATNNTPGFNFKLLLNVAGTSVTRVTATQVTITITAHGLVPNDVIWINEVTGTIATGSGATANQNINGQTGYVAAVVDANTITVNFDGTKGSSTANFQAGATGAGGIAQYLTSTITGQDGIKWYDGDPTAANGIPAGTGKGWVNFSPPLTAATVSINDKTIGLYYLVGALAIVPFKDRLVFFSPWIQTSTGSAIQLPDTVIWSWNGTPYYNALTPTNETYDVTAYYVDQTGKGGWLSAGISQPITTVSTNEDALLVGFGGNGRKTRFVYTGDDLQPFLFFTINTELPSSSTFSSITLDRGALDLGPYGIALTDQQSSQRIDVETPDEVFKIQNLNNGVLRVNALRDFQNEFIYFTYPINNSPWKFPTRSFLFNYRDNTWAILYENYTAQGRYRQQIKNNWTSIGQRYGSWAGWLVPWNAPATSALYANLIAGNPQGYVLIRDTGTSEAVSGTIKAIANDGAGMTQITSYNHCVQSQDPFLLNGDFLYFSNAIGSTYLNGQIGKVTRIIDADNFVIDIPFQAGTYTGLGNFTRLCQPIMQTKQFNFYWQQGRQTRLCSQKYLLDKTAIGQVTIDIYLNQNEDDVWNKDPVVPDPNTTNSSLIYSQLLYTCPESTNLGLTPANINLQTPTATSAQQQIWHRMNTSLQGDSFQIGVTLSDAQMKNLTFATSEIVIHGIQFTVAQGPLLA